MDPQDVAELASGQFDVINGMESSMGAAPQVLQVASLEKISGRVAMIGISVGLLGERLGFGSLPHQLGVELGLLS